MAPRGAKPRREGRTSQVTAPTRGPAQAEAAQGQAGVSLRAAHSPPGVGSTGRGCPPGLDRGFSQSCPFTPLAVTEHVQTEAVRVAPGARVRGVGKERRRPRQGRQQAPPTRASPQGGAGRRMSPQSPHAPGRVAQLCGRRWPWCPSTEPLAPPQCLQVLDQRAALSQRCTAASAHPGPRAGPRAGRAGGRVG